MGIIPKGLVKYDDSENYTATVVKLPVKQKVEGLDKLVKVTVFGNDVLTGKDTPEDELYLFFPAECKLSDVYLGTNNEFRHSEKNKDRSKTGFFEDSGRVKAIKFKGVISTGYIAPISSLEGVTSYHKTLKVGDEFNEIDGVPICIKYRPTRMQSTNPKESRFNKKLKRFSKLVPNQFRFHVSTPQLARCLNQFSPKDVIVITDKWHGTSAVFSNLLVNKELKWYEKLGRFLVLPFMKKYLNFQNYDNLYSSRTVIKNEYLNMGVGGGYYGEDIWGVVNKEIEGKIEQGVSIFGEIVGYLPSGKMIQNGYDYGCKDLGPGVAVRAEHKFVVYRITYTKPDGTVIEYSWQQIKDYCNKYSLEIVKELYHGKAYDLAIGEGDVDTFFQTNFLETLQGFIEQDCKYCSNKVPAEGIVVRLDGKDSFSAFKLKSKRFLEKESKELDKGEVNIEDEHSN